MKRIQKKELQTAKTAICRGRRRRTAGAAAGCLMMLLFFCGCGADMQQDAPVVVLTEDAAGEAADAAEAEETSVSASDGQDVIAVYVCGAVQHAGVYELPEGSRVHEALALAGGLTEDAAQTAVNQAERLTDGQMITIPTAEEAEQLAAEQAAAQDGLVNINTADEQELKTLPGIGDAKARSIIAYREKNGAFRTIEDIKNIEGIKEGVFAKLQDHIKVE